jgi:Cu/Ag efflux protein CusF
MIYSLQDRGSRSRNGDARVRLFESEKTVRQVGFGPTPAFRIINRIFTGFAMTRTRSAFVSFVACLVGGCGQSVDQETAGAVAVEHMATGTFNSVDQAEGTINITHGPVPSADWPEMTMNFRLADPGAAAELKPGERVDFHFRIESGMSATVILITPLD